MAAFQLSLLSSGVSAQVEPEPEPSPLQRNVKRFIPILAVTAVAMAPGCSLLKGPPKGGGLTPVSTFETDGAAKASASHAGSSEGLFAQNSSGTTQGSISIDSVLNPGGAKKPPSPPSPPGAPTPPTQPPFSPLPPLVPTPLRPTPLAPAPPPAPAPALPAGLTQQQLLALSEKGETVAKAYCSACHLFPDPGLLDRQTWLEEVLPAMRAGGSRHCLPVEPGPIVNVTLDANPLEAARVRAPILSDEIWQGILAYFAVNAPEELERPEPPRPIDFDLRHFRVEMPTNHLVDKPATNAIRIDETRGQILIGATDPNFFVIFDNKLNAIQEARLSSPPTWFEHFTEPGSTQRKLSITLAGQMDPNDFAVGNLIAVTEQPAGSDVVYDFPETLLTKLRRPVATRFGDFNGDGLPDPAVSQFGDTIGQLALYEADAQGQISEKILIPRPGSISSYVLDYDEDGAPDIVTLMTQAREGVYLLRNDGAGSFTEQPLLLLPPVYGSSSFELADFNGDGKLDIIMTCGDNADHSMIFKPYHGVYIYLNQGGDKFEQAYFYPMNGAFNVKARDFDLDGDLDFAAVAYFADFALRPFEAFVYFENKGDAELFDFHPFSMDEAVAGRWLPMDVGDVDGDGDTDIVLGNFLRRLMGPGSLPADLHDKWSQPGPHFLLLRNTIRDGEN